MAPSKPRFDLEDRSVLITGANRGLGAALCKTILQYSPKIIHAGYRTAPGNFHDSRIHWCQLDIQDIESVANAAASVDELDVLINNAALYGGLTGGRFNQLDEDEWDRTMDVNVKGIWNCCKAAVPHMQTAGGGSIINVASLAATYGLPYALHYTTSTWVQGYLL